MTRINLIDPAELTDQHLIAEYRETRLLCANLKRHLNSTNPIPATFTLNTGHCTFFKDKGAYISDRYQSLIREMQSRGFTPQFGTLNIEWWPDHLFNDWEPSERDKQLIRDRIKQRMLERPGWYKYKGKVCN